MVVRLSAFFYVRVLPAGRFLVLIPVSSSVEPRAIVLLEDSGKLKRYNDRSDLNKLRYNAAPK
jgi:hypothetical protein